ncbi:MAG: HEAT repeat domain-containing protein, partial [Planctomycetota bacterium]
SREEHRDAAAPLILQFLQSKKASQRNEAAEILPELIGEDARAALEQSLETEKGKRVQQTIRRELQNLDHANTAAAGGGDDPGNDAGDSDPHWQPITLPPLAVPTQVPPLPGGFETAFRNAIAQSTEKAEKHYKQQLAHFNGPDRPRWMRQPTKPSLITDDEINSMIDYLQGKSGLDKMVRSKRTQLAQFLPEPSKWADLSLLSLHHIIRLLFLLEKVRQHRSIDFTFNDQSPLDQHRAAQQQPYGLREVESVCADLPGYQAGIIAASYLINNNDWNQFLAWEPQAVWPLFVEQPEMLLKALRGEFNIDYYHEVIRRNAIRVTEMMPRVPPRIENELWGLALGEAKTDRPLARAAVRKSSDALDRSLAALTDGKQAIRIAAAEMLADLANPDAVAALKKVLKKEKQEIVKGAMLQAIESSGGDVEE